jgi:hypothetical protein
MVREMFLNSSSMGLYNESDVTILENPSANDLRKTIIDYTLERSAKGDIIVFYYSGHGVVLGNNEFVFCPRDIKFRDDSHTLLPLSGVTFRDVLSTLQAADIHPVFIIDACFSGKAASRNLIQAMQDQMHQTAASSYALFCACYEDSMAMDTLEGGAFTKAIYEVVSEGLADPHHKQLWALELHDLTKSVQTKLENIGMPLSKLYTSDDLPNFLLVRNLAYRVRSESFMSYHTETLELMWNGGKPESVLLSDINQKIGAGAYGNHSKLSLAPWNLAEGGKNSHERRLTQRGIEFMQGRLSIPSTLVRDPHSEEWNAADGATELWYSDAVALKDASKKRTRKRQNAKR